MTAEGDALVLALGRLGDILRRGDVASAETVEINENANDGSNDPADPPIPGSPWVWRWQLCTRVRD